MKVRVLHSTPLWVADLAISKCYDKECNQNEVNKKRIENVVNVNKHESTIEHVYFNIEIEGVSRALLQELARHRIASYSVKSTRYTLKELKDEKTFTPSRTEEYSEAVARAKKYIVFTGNKIIDDFSIDALENLRTAINANIKNDIAKFCMPECYKTNLVWTINARSLKNFLNLRTSKNAMWEIRELAYAIYGVVPMQYKFLFEKEIYKDSENK